VVFGRAVGLAQVDHVFFVLADTRFLCLWPVGGWAAPAARLDQTLARLAWARRTTIWSMLGVLI
ncbi:hypothetical protein ACPTKM_30520, partial [Pseudomonas aeruginosa]|uniref:hypothetical protein n=1 Tax=Pseudomonas aeruginosa TaxID=287 RepID=UPI003CC6CDA4